jgi:hypothetical protein
VVIRVVNVAVQVSPELASRNMMDNRDEETEETEESAVDNLPFVCQKFAVIGASSSGSAAAAGGDRAV